MTIRVEHQEDVAAMPPALRALLEAELAAGNDIVDVGHSFPAPPAGAYFKLAKPVGTRPRESGDGIVFYDRNTSSYSGEFTDTKRFYFILEPPHPPEPEPDMDAIREAIRKRQGVEPVPPTLHYPSPTAPPYTPPTHPAASAPPKDEDAVSKFKRSMIVDYEKWHDGIGYDLDILRAATPLERQQIEALIHSKGVNDWRDVEALADIKSPTARTALRAALKHSDHSVRAAVRREMPELLSDADRTASIVEALEHADFYGGLTQTLDEVEDFHPPKVIDALFRGALERKGDVAVHFAAMLMFLHGKSKEAFDWEQREFFLRFNTPDRKARESVFGELCERLGRRPV